MLPLGEPNRRDIEGRRRFFTKRNITTSPEVDEYYLEEDFSYGP